MKELRSFVSCEGTIGNLPKTCEFLIVTAKLVWQRHLKGFNQNWSIIYRWLGVR